jgi:hypothetical protein
MIKDKTMFDTIMNNRTIMDAAAILLSIFLGIGCVIATALYMDYWQAKEAYKKLRRKS